jgi:molecular chaperone HtpG
LETALSRWCRFAAVPIKFSSVDHDRNDPAAKRRIDLPLSVPSSLYVQANRDKERFVVGPSAGTDRFLTAGVAADDPAKGKTTFAGFYNRGLTLFETDEPLHPTLVNVRLRVDSPHLRHTLSRDNVLRDKAFERIISKARDLVQKSLRRELTSRLSRAARDVAQANQPYDPELIASYAAFLEAALLPPFVVPYDEIMIPLAAPSKDDRVISLKQMMSQKNLFVVSAPDQLSMALAKVGHFVVLAPDVTIHSTLSLLIPQPGLQSPEKNFILAKEFPDNEMTDTDRALCLALENNLHALGLRVRSISMGTASAEMEAPCILTQTPTKRVDDKLWLCPIDFAEQGWSKTRPDGALLLIATNEIVKLAREHARKDTFMAAHILTRFLLLSRTDNDGSTSDTLFLSAAMEVV